jgi:hypothetical protein
MKTEAYGVKRRTVGPMEVVVTGRWTKLHGEQLYYMDRAAYVPFLNWFLFLY